MANEETTLPLFEAIKNDSIDQVAAALDAGADVDADLGYFGKPLGHAVVHASVEIAALLLDRGAQVDGVDKKTETALHRASRGGRVEVAELLVSRGALLEVADQLGFTPLLQALWHAKHEMVTWLLDRGARMDVVTSSGCTVLHFAAGSGYPDFARMLQDAHVAAVVDAKAVWFSEAALHQAAVNGHLDHVRQLLNAGASADVITNVQRTPLHLACAHGHVEVGRELLQRGAHVDAVDKNGCSPLLLSAHNTTHIGQQVVRLLLEHGADRSLQDRDGRTARDLAVARRNDAVVAVLDTYFPLTVQMEQMLLGLRGPTESPLTRFAQHSAFEPKVLSIVAAFHSGKGSPAFARLQCEAAGQGQSGGDEASS